MKAELLRNVPLFAGWLEHETRCLNFLEEGEEVCAPAGAQVVTEGEPAAFYILLEGAIEVSKRVGNEEMPLTTYLPGAYFGEVPLLLDTPFVATGRAVAASRLFRIPPSAFWEMLGQCPVVTRQIVNTMAGRVQNLEAVGQGQSRLDALGTMAAGLAHELNNPASAARRAAEQLGETLDGLQRHALALNRSLTPAQWDALHALVQETQDERGAEGASDPLAQSDMEDELASLCGALGVAEAWRIAPVLVEAGWSRSCLEALAAHLPPDSLSDALCWLEANFTLWRLVDDVRGSTARVSDIVEAVKAYSFMDQAPLQDVDVRQGLDSTLTMLAFQIRRKDITVTRDYSPALPTLCARGAELNQVWTNLLDNAIYAVPQGGRIEVRAGMEGNRILVEISDNGPGIPDAVKEHIFEPFFTTKNVGEGAGLGLVTAYRIVSAHHHGGITVQSQPGSTRFQIRLPVTLPERKTP